MLRIEAPRCLRLPRIRPAAQAPPNVLGIERQELADILECERQLTIRTHEPFLGFAKQPPAAIVPGEQILLKAVDRVFEDRDDEPPLAAV